MKKSVKAKKIMKSYIIKETNKYSSETIMKKLDFHFASHFSIIRECDEIFEDFLDGDLSQSFISLISKKRIRLYIDNVYFPEFVEIYSYEEDYELVEHLLYTFGFSYRQSLTYDKSPWEIDNDLSDQKIIAEKAEEALSNDNRVYRKLTLERNSKDLVEKQLRHIQDILVNMSNYILLPDNNEFNFFNMIDVNIISLKSEKIISLVFDNDSTINFMTISMHMLDYDNIVNIFKKYNIKFKDGISISIDIYDSSTYKDKIKKCIEENNLIINSTKRELFDKYVETMDEKYLTKIKRYDEDFEKEFMKTINKLDNHQRIIIYAYYKNYKKLLQRIKRADNIEDYSCYFDELNYNYRMAFHQFLVEYIIDNANNNELSDTLVIHYDKYLIDTPFMSEMVANELYKNYEESTLLKKLIPSFKRGDWTCCDIVKLRDSFKNFNFIQPEFQNNDLNVGYKRVDVDASKEINVKDVIVRTIEPLKSFELFKARVSNASLEEHLSLLRVEIEYLIKTVNSKKDFSIENHFNTLLNRTDINLLVSPILITCNNEIYHYFNIIKTIKNQLIISKVLEGLHRFVGCGNVFKYANFIAFASENKIKYDKHDFLTVVTRLFDIYQVKHMDRVHFFQEHKRKPYVQLFLIDEYLKEVEKICINKTKSAFVDSDEKNLYLSKMSSLYNKTDDKENLVETLREKINNSPTREDIKTYATIGNVEDLLYLKNLQACALAYEYIHDFDFGAGADKVYHFKVGFPEDYIEFIRIIFREVLRKANNYEGLNHSYMETLPEVAYSLYDVEGGLKWFNLIVKKILETNCSYLNKLFNNMLKDKKIEIQ